MARKLIERDIIIFGFDRVSFVARLHEYGRSFNASLKKAVRISTIPWEATGRVQRMLEELLQIKVGEIGIF